MLSYRSAFFGPKHVYPLAFRWRQYSPGCRSGPGVPGSRGISAGAVRGSSSCSREGAGKHLQFPGEDCTSAMLSYHEHCTTTSLCDRRNAQNLRRPVLSDNTGKWRTRMTDRERRIFESVAGGCLERYGYDRSLAQPRISRFLALSCRFFEHPPRRISAMLRNGRGPPLGSSESTASPFPVSKCSNELMARSTLDKGTRRGYSRASASPRLGKSDGTDSVAIPRNRSAAAASTTKTLIFPAFPRPVRSVT